MRSKQLQHRRSQLIGSQPEVPAAFLAGQRQKIQERLAEKRQSFALRPIPAAAMALLLVAVMLWFRPATKPTAVAEISDAELFQKVYAEVYASQPRAVEPLQSLFEKNQ
jgi:hypothetical protein